MLAVVAQWTGKEQVHANCVVPILVSSEQGHLKSTFCKGLPPLAFIAITPKNFRSPHKEMPNGNWQKWLL